jgi:hypothetical protein
MFKYCNKGYKLLYYAIVQCFLNFLRSQNIKQYFLMWNSYENYFKKKKGTKLWR